MEYLIASIIILIVWILVLHTMIRRAIVSAQRRRVTKREWKRIFRRRRLGSPPMRSAFLTSRTGWSYDCPRGPGRGDDIRRRERWRGYVTVNGSRKYFSAPAKALAAQKRRALLNQRDSTGIATGKRYKLGE